MSKKRLTKKQKKRRQKICFFILILFVVLSTSTLYYLIKGGIGLVRSFGESDINYAPSSKPSIQQNVNTKDNLAALIKPSINEMLLTPNEYSRPQIPLTTVNGIVVHYVGNPNTSATANRNYFNDLAKTKTTYASAHYVIDMDGTILQCIPLDEIAYCSNDRNEDTISIEVTHPDKTGKFTRESYNSLIQLLSYLSIVYELEVDDIIRHYDVSGKLCPLYYVEHPDKWEQLKVDVSDSIKTYTTKK